jgi:predicted O-linked N-acetylglucosamine transferase (SPINDLY family)
MQTSSKQAGFNIADDLRRGLVYHQSGHLAKAQEIYRSILKIDPFHPDALNLAGLVALDSGDLERAGMFISRAIEADPERADFYNNLGNVLQQKECLQEAAQYYHRAIALMPGYAAAHFNLGNVNQKLYKRHAAIKNYRRALEIEPEFASACFNLGKLYRTENDFNQSLLAFHEVIRLNPEHVDAFKELADIYDQLAQTDQAIYYYEKLLELEPDCWTTCFNLGNLYRHQNKIDSAIHSYLNALRINPQSAEIYLNLGIAYKIADNLVEAEQCYRRCIEIKPDLAEVYYNLGNLCRESGRTEQAIQNYQQALEINPAMVEVLNNLAELYRHQGLFDAALECLSRSLETEPHHPETLHNLGITLTEIGRAEDAIEAFERALAIQPDLSLARNGLGSAYLAMERIDEADLNYRQALNTDPDNPVMLYNLGMTCQSRGEFESSKYYFKQALKFAPDLIPARWQYELLLPILYNDLRGIAFYRQRFEKGLDYLIQNTGLNTPDQCRQAMTGIGGKTNFYLPYQGKNDVDLQQKYGTFAVKIMSANYPQWARVIKMPPLKLGSKIRVGFVSSYLYHHTVGIFLKGWVENLNHSQIETYGYQIGKKSDALTTSFKACFNHYRSVADSLEQAAEKIVLDDLHLLVFTDIGMNPLSIQLAALRLAPIQCKGWGHPVTTGLPTMDYYLSSDLMEPENGQSYYTERLIRLPNLALCYQKPALPESPVDRSAFGIAETDFVYLSPQSLFKYLPQYDELFPRIAQKVPKAKFIFISHQTESVTQRFRERLGWAFEKYHLCFSNFCRILPRLNLNEFLSLNLSSNVLLDTLDWSGGKTSIEGLSCGLPLVTLPGEFMRGRHAYAMLKMMGIRDTIAQDIDHYVEIAARLGIDPILYRQIRSKVEKNGHRLFDDHSVPAALEEFIVNTVKDAQTGE